MIGTAQMREELESLGLEAHGLGEELGDARFDRAPISIKQLDEWQVDPEIGAVICGTDLQIDYSKIAVASLHLQRGV